MRSSRGVGSRATFLQWAGSEVAKSREAGTLKVERVIASPQNGQIVTGGAKVVNMCANNYLGLANHPRILARAKETLESRGFGLASVRFICGTQDIHKELEGRLAKFHGMEDAILYGSCFDANGGIFEVLLQEQDSVVSDELNHASIIDGVRLSKARRFRYKHRDMAELEQNLISAKDSPKILIATDGVFSMDGTIAPLGSIVKLAKQHGALVMVDECHATGFLGRGGRGTPALEDGAQPDIISSTLGKCLGGATGGYIAGPGAIIELLRQRSRPYLFSNSVAPSVVGASLAALDIAESSEGDALRSKLASNIASFRSLMSQIPLAVGGDPRHAICPVAIGDAAKAQKAAARLLEMGVYAIGFSYPVVPVGKARIRIQISAAHSPEDIKRAVEAFATVKREFDI